jgi:hypothetical protein
MRHPVNAAGGNRPKVSYALTTRTGDSARALRQQGVPLTSSANFNTLGKALR